MENMESNEFIISISSNQDTLRNIKAAKSALRQSFPQALFSDFVSTEAIGKHYQSPFFNGAACIATALSLEAFTALLKQMEVEAGRTPEMKAAGIVPVDLDIIVFNNAVVHRDYARFPFVKNAIDSLWFKK